MRSFFVLMTLQGFDEMRRQLGHFRAGELLDALAIEISGKLGAGSPVRVGRSAVEFIARAASASDADHRLRRLAAAVGGSVTVRGRKLPRLAIVGAARCARGQVTEAVIAEAELALARASAEQRSTHVTEAMTLDERALMDDLQAAARSDQLKLLFQPKVHARTGKVVACEALARWSHPTLGEISPELFIGVAERRGQIAPFTYWAMEKAIEAARWMAGQGLTIPIYVNLSARLVTDCAFIDGLLDVLKGHESEIGLELTETCMIADPEGALASMNRLAAGGLKLAIDDYGAGFSSLAYLQRLPIHELKIDRSFIARLTSGARDPLLVRSTIDLAHALEMEVTAEGVESAASLALLQVMRCDMVQGYFLSRPLPIKELLSYGLAAANRSSLDVSSSLASRFARSARSRTA